MVPAPDIIDDSSSDGSANLNPADIMRNASGISLTA
jgi:hypothetical protein